MTTIVTGHYGAGKTEFCLNYAQLQRQKTGQPILLADLDVINPYFRSRERAEYLQKRGILVVGSQVQPNIVQDMPAIDYGFATQITQGAQVIIDLAGTEVGLRPLASLYHSITQIDYAFLCILNHNRPETNTVEKMQAHLSTIQASTPLKITGLVNNSHMLHETTAEHVLAGQSAVEEVSKTTNIPVRYTQLSKQVFQSIPEGCIQTPTIVFDQLSMRKTWQ